MPESDEQRIRDDLNEARRGVERAIELMGKTKGLSEEHRAGYALMASRIRIELDRAFPPVDSA